MCGIVGLFLKDRALEPELGALLAGMLGTMRDRGPDSAGFAVYGAAAPRRDQADRPRAARLRFRRPRAPPRSGPARRSPHVVHDTHLVLTVPVRG